jgi:hypothetical protein
LFILIAEGGVSAANITGWFIVLTLCVIAIYDYYMHVEYGAVGTISGFIYRLNQRWAFFAYILAFAMGILFGHLFF